MKRKVHYVHVASNVNAIADLTNRNWLALIYLNTFAAKQHNAMLETIIAANPLFVYGVAQNFTDLEDAITLHLVEQIGDFEEDAVLPLVYADHDLQEALEFSVKIAFHETKEIEEVYLLDCNVEKLDDAKLEALMQKVR